MPTRGRPRPVGDVVSGFAPTWSLPLPVILAAALSSVLFAQAFLRLRRRGRTDHARWGRAVLFALGLAVLVLALVSPLEPAGEDYLLSMHMLQHALLIDVVPALLVLALRGPLTFFFLPPVVLRPLADVLTLRRVLHFLLRPAVTFGVWAGVLVAWHVPAAYDYALEHQWAHDLEHVSFVGIGVLLWSQLLDPARRRVLSTKQRGLYGLAVLGFTHLLLHPVFLAMGPLYARYRSQPVRLFGLSPLADQHLAAWVMTTEQLLTVGVAAFLLLVRPGIEPRRLRARARPARGAVSAIGRSLVALLPRGGSLPDEEFGRRHRRLVGFLWANAIGLALYSGLSADGLLPTLVSGAVPAVLAVGAGRGRLGRQRQSVLVALGLLSSAALLVYLSGGLIEAHFYFFVIIVVLTLYEDWLPFLLAVGFVLVHHGVIGTLEPRSVFNHQDAWRNPWEWAAIHAAFVAAAGAAGVLAWRLNEDVRARMRESERQLELAAMTDSLTGLPNRRALMAELERVCAGSGAGSALALFDLNGFKNYNDRYGHQAGDALLVRLSQRLLASVAEEARAYRLGGDEFCMLGALDLAAAERLVETAADALSEQGQGFWVSASYGLVAIPGEARSPEEVLRVADQRMYAQKISARGSALTQSRDVLLQVLSERHPSISDHVDSVAEMAVAVARSLDVDEAEIARVHRAAKLHDIGKLAVPDAILDKPGPLDEAEWEFMKSHVVIGERIVAAAPALADIADIVRGSHEHFDGTGYPDGLLGDAIPIGSRIIAACDALDAMLTHREYRSAVDLPEALTELERQAGKQFDPRVIEALLEHVTTSNVAAA
jgi:diguanylate cyclase (GGDEF)-like protein